MMRRFLMIFLAIFIVGWLYGVATTESSDLKDEKVKPIKKGIVKRSKPSSVAKMYATGRALSVDEKSLTVEREIKKEGKRISEIMAFEVSYPPVDIKSGDIIRVDYIRNGSKNIAVRVVAKKITADK
ncbi:MAG: hypothetical protein WCJ49_05055 [Deltaproteobacteria bacterium]